MFDFEWNTPEEVERRDRACVKIHRLGRSKFILRAGVFGCITGIVVCATNFCLDLLLSDKLKHLSVKTLLTYAGCWCLFGLAYGLFFWHQNEKRYRSESSVQ